LKPLQLLEGFVESALETGFVAGNLAERVGVLSVVTHDEGQVGLGIEGGEVFHPSFQVRLAVGEEAGLHPARSVHAPAGGDHVFHQDCLDETDGLAFVYEGEAELLEIDFLFHCGQDDFSGGEAVFEGVHAHSGASLGCDWAVALGCVTAICFVLSFGDHKFPFLL
jgi:hypothetical protein